MRVLVLHSRYLSGEVSGENRVVEDEANLLRGAGCEVVVWQPSAGDVRPLRAGMRAIRSSSAVSEVRELLATSRPDVVHIHNLFPMLSPAIIPEAARVAPVVMTLHNFRLLCLPATFLRDGKSCESCLGKAPWRGVVHACYRSSRAGSASLASSLFVHRAVGTFDHVDRFLAVGEFVKDKYVNAGFDPSRIIVKPNFAHESSVRRTAGEYFLFLGRISEEKGVELLIESWRRVDAQLLVAGDGPLLDRLRDQAPRNVRFVGRVAPAEANSILRGARALLVPSTCYEAAPRVVLEAAAAGVPTIATNHGGFRELIRHGETGLLVAPVAHAWQRALATLRDDRTVIGLGKNALELWRSCFSPERAIANLLAAYADARSVSDLRHASGTQRAEPLVR